MSIALSLFSGFIAWLFISMAAANCTDESPEINPIFSAIGIAALGALFLCARLP